MTGAALPQPLAGLRVLDLTRLLPGGLVTRWLADLGAEVLKVEEAGRGDYLRNAPPFVEGRAIMPALYDRGKASLEVDFATVKGKETVRRLADVADIVVDGARPGATARTFGLDIAELRARRPEVIVCSITGFGLDGALSDMPSHGMTIDTLAGVGDPQREGTHWRLSGTLGSVVGVEVGALNAVIAVLAGVLNVRAGGPGSWIDVSMWDAAVEANRLNVSLALAGRDDRVTMGAQGPLYSVYECADGQLIFLAAIEARFWSRFCLAIDRPDLVGRREEGELGFGEGESVRRELAAVFSGRTSADWGELFAREDIPGNRVLSVREVTTHPHFGDRALVRDATGADPVPHLLNPVKFVESGERLGSRSRPAPLLGEGGVDVCRRWLVPSSVSG